VWTNCDGAGAIGLALLGIHWLAEEWEAAAGHGGTPAHVRVLRLVVPASAAACLANPCCYHALAMGSALPRAAWMPALALSGRPPDLAHPREHAVLVGGLLLLIGGLGFSPGRRRPADIGLALFVTFLALASQRHLALFLIGIVPAAAVPLARLLREGGAVLGRAPGLRHLSASPFGQRWSMKVQQMSARRSPLYWLPLAMLCGWALFCAVAQRPVPTATEALGRTVEHLAVRGARQN
jgi:hypothetical protein